jgi:hypothetical protein
MAATSSVRASPRPSVERTTLTSAVVVGRDPFRDHEGDGPLVEGLVVRVDEFD